MLGRMWRKGNLSALLVGMQIGAATMESNMEIPQKLKIDLPFDPVIPFLEIYLKEPKTNQKEHKHPYVHCNVIYNHQDIEAAQVSINRCVVKQLWDIYTMGFYLAIKKQENFTLCNSIDGPGEHFAK